MRSGTLSFQTFEGVSNEPSVPRLPKFSLFSSSTLTILSTVSASCFVSTAASSSVYYFIASPSYCLRASCSAPSISLSFCYSSSYLYFSSSSSFCFRSLIQPELSVTSSHSINALVHSLYVSKILALSVISGEKSTSLEIFKMVW